MTLTVKKVTLWRKEVSDAPGTLGDVLAPLAEAGVHLRLVMGYKFPSGSGRSAIEVFPIAGKKAMAAASAAGLSASPIACLHVEGDDRAGLGADMARAVADKGVNISFVMAEAVGRRFSAVSGFESNADASVAARAIKAAAQRRKR